MSATHFHGVALIVVSVNMWILWFLQSCSLLWAKTCLATSVKLSISPSHAVYPWPFCSGLLSEPIDLHQENPSFTFPCFSCFFLLFLAKKVLSLKSTDYLWQAIPCTFPVLFMLFSGRTLDIWSLLVPFGPFLFYLWRFWSQFYPFWPVWSVFIHFWTFLLSIFGHLVVCFSCAFS